MNKRVVVVTGGSTGIGLAVAKRFLINQDRVYVLDVNELIDKTIEVNFIKADISKKEEVFSAVSKIITKEGKIDVLVNNAAIQVIKPFTSVTIEEIEAVLKTNLLGTIYMIKACVSYMESASIINLSSIYANKGRKNKSAYDMSKAAITSLTKTLAIELANKNIRVNTIEPGAVSTKMNDYFKDEETLAKVLKRIPLNKVGAPEDIANFAFFLASKEASYITGTNITIDGGRSLV